MMFADRSDIAVSGLQRAFSLEREAARRLIADAPIVVKRSATPEVAAALIDVLNQLGAQVVLLPSATPSPVAEPPQSQARAQDDAGVTWGGLDLAPEPQRARIELDLASEPPPARAPSPAPPPLEYALDSDPERDEEVLRSPAPPAPAPALPDPDELFGAPLIDATRADEREDSQEFALGAEASDEPPPLEPLQTGPRMSLRAASPQPSLPALPSPSRIGHEPGPPAIPSLPPRVSARPNAPPPPRVASPVPALPNLDLELGLGPLPPLPNANTVRSMPPRPPAIPSQRPQLSIPPVPSRRPPQRPAQRAESTLTFQLDAPKIEAPKKPVTDNYWSSRRSADAPLFGESNEPAAAPARAAKEPTGAFNLEMERTAVKSQVAVAPRARPIESRKRMNPRVGRALALLGGAAVLGGGLQLGDSVLAGTATPISIALHGIALCGLACGALGVPLRSRWQPLWLALACMLAFALNQATMARVPYELSYGERTVATGTLSIGGGDAGHAMKLATIHVIALDVERRIGAPLVVRELWLRSPELAAEGELDVELFAEFGRDREVDARARNMAAIEHHELRVLPVGRGSNTRSRLRLPGVSTPWLVRDGSLRIERAQAIDTPGVATWQVEGTLDLELRDGSEQRHVHGSVDARLTWN
jgi:hypothetical protein